MIDGSFYLNLMEVGGGNYPQKEAIVSNRRRMIGHPG